MDYRKFLSEDEKPEWVIQPNQVLFVLVYGIIRTPMFLLLIYAAIFSFTSFTENPRTTFDLFDFSARNIFFLVCGTLGVLLLYSSVVHSNTYYILTSQRLILTGGIFGTDIKSIELNQITDLRLGVNPIDHLLSSGKITVSTAGSTAQRSIYENTLLALDNPEKVFNSMRAALKGRSRS